MARPLRLAVVGLGHFAQAAILPAVDQLKGVTLAALVSGSADKRAELARRYRCERAYDYAQYEEMLESGAVDAVYIALPNDQHAAYALRAADHGIHVLVEKPMATTEEECQLMLDACAREGVMLMVAYRLHFQPANLHVIDLIKRDTIGEARIFDSVFSFQVREGNTRIEPRAGAGPLFDLGIYCVNAARYVFQDEPIAVQAFRMDNPDDERFRFVEEGMAVTMRFRGGRVANFVCSYGAGEQSRYEVIGTDGHIEVENAYEYTTSMSVTHVRDGRRRKKTFRKTDQIAAEILYFARCVRDGITPEPSGPEGLADVRILLAIHEAARTGRTVHIAEVPQDTRPQPAQSIVRPAHREPRLVDVESASRD